MVNKCYTMQTHNSMISPNIRFVSFYVQLSHFSSVIRGLSSVNFSHVFFQKENLADQEQNLRKFRSSESVLIDLK